MAGTNRNRVRKVTMTARDLKEKVIEGAALYFFRQSDPPLEIQDLMSLPEGAEFEVTIRDIQRIKAQDLRSGSILCPDGMIRNVVDVSSFVVVRTDVFTEIYKSNQEIILIKE